MIKYFCDLCEKEMRKDEHYTYILPQQVPYEVVANWGETLYTYEKLEDKEIEICDVCRRKISYALKKLVKEDAVIYAQLNMLIYVMVMCHLVAVQILVAMRLYYDG